MDSEAMELNGDAHGGDPGVVSDSEHISIIKKNHKRIRRWDVSFKVEHIVSVSMKSSRVRLEYIM